MTEKRLQVDSMYAHLDTNKDGVVSDHELMIKERMIKLENQDKKEDQQRFLVWFSALSVTVFIVVLMTPLIPMERIDHLSGIAEIWVLSNMGVIGSFIGFTQIAKKKENL